MLDENLPVFFLKTSTTGIKHHASLYLSHHGSDPEPTYSLQYLDPASPLQAHKNCYAAALFDAHNPDVLYGEVLARPIWTQPTLSAEEIRRHGGIPPPPEPRVPLDFTVQLYNPDQQIPVRLKEGKWGCSDTYEFTVPEKTFRAPSASNLDRGQSDPAGLDITPRINFVWKRESKFSKDLTCFMTGKSTDTEKKRSKKDPDIAIALWRNMREMTMYESNLYRVDTEDPKGLEVSLLLSAIVIKDFYFTSSDKWADTFNLEELNTTRRKTSNPQSIASGPPPLPRRRVTPTQVTHDAQSQAALHAPPPDPREQWQIDAETARLRAVAIAEKKEVQRQQREREKAAEAERKRLQKMVEQEEREARRKADDVERETERLRRQYGLEGQSLRPDMSGYHREQNSRRSFQGDLQSRPQVGPNGLPYASSSSSSYTMSGANPSASMLHLPTSAAKKKKSMFGLRSTSDDNDGRNRLAKKQSSVW